jgi:uncharacterized caspase-like protein
MFGLSSSAYYLLPHDFDREDIPKTELSAQTLSERLKQIEAKRLWVIVDSCHAERMASAKGDRSASRFFSYGFAEGCG